MRTEATSPALPTAPVTQGAAPTTRSRPQSIAPEIDNWGDHFTDPDVHAVMPLNATVAEVAVDVHPQEQAQEQTPSAPAVGNGLAIAAVLTGVVIGGGLLGMLLYFNVQAEP